MNASVMVNATNECLASLGRSFVSKSSAIRLQSANEALKEAEKILKLAEGLVEICSARVCMLGGTPESSYKEPNPE